MFISYDAWSLEEKNENPQLHWLNRRNFPSSSELDMFEFLRNNGDHKNDNASNGLETGILNIVTWPSEYQTRIGLLGKFQGFLGVPIPKMLQSHLALNASSLESFYSILSTSNASLIVVPSGGTADRNDLTGADTGEIYLGQRVGTENGVVGKSAHELPDIAKFALMNFQKIYQDNGFTILDVPNHIKPSSPDGDVAFVHPSTQENLFLQSTVFNPENHNNVSKSKVILPYNNQFFSKISDSDFIKIMENKKDVTLNAYNKSQTLWSSNVEFRNGDLDYIGSKFKVVDQNKNKPHDECGVVWQSGDKKYYVRIRDDKLEFSETPAPKDRYNIENQQVNLDKWISYTLKINFLEDYLNVYVDDILRLRVPSYLYDNNNTISKIGIRCAGNTAEFGPIEIAGISKTDYGNDNYYNTDSLLEKEHTYQYYYPLTSLALSGVSYDTFLPNDYSIFSKGNIVLTARVIGDIVENELNNKDKLNQFLGYVRNGGTLTVINTDKKADGWLPTSFFSIKYGNRY